MKKYPLRILRGHGLARGVVSPRRLALVLTLGSAVFGLVANRAAAQGEPLEVGVRSSVPDKTYLWSNNKNKIKGEGGHSKVYGIFKVSLIRAPEDLVKPVDEKYITSVLMHELDANGFREFTQGQRPDILITASYGGAELSNPYMHDTGEVGGISNSVAQSELLSNAHNNAAANPSMFPDAPGINSWGPVVTHDNPAPGQTITDINQLYEDKERGHEANLQKAGYEKMYIRVTAWQYPKASDTKPRMLWKTIMVVDDPDHRDLNEVAEAMLKAGAPLFDKLHKDPEVLVNTTIPEGHVNVGTPEVVDPGKPKKKS